MHELTERPNGHDVVLVAALSSHASMVKVLAMARGTVRPRPSMEQDMNPRQITKQLPLTVQLPASQDKVTGM